MTMSFPCHKEISFFLKDPDGCEQLQEWNGPNKTPLGRKTASRKDQKQ
jgi:hypothetical protein